MNTRIKIDEVLTGVWHNQHNSELHLKVDKSGRLNGFFIKTPAKAKDSSEWFPVTGFARGDVFTFSVDFSKWGCMTAWVGQIVDPSSKRFESMWQMVSDAYNRTDLAWKSTCVGEDIFEAGPCASTLKEQETTTPQYCSFV